MMKKSIYATIPKNEAELSVIEKETQKYLQNSLDVNLTKKKAQKLRNITCLFLGFPNGYQQLLSYWESLRPAVIEDVKSLIIELEKGGSGFIFFNSESAVNLDATSEAVHHFLEHTKKKFPQKSKHKENPIAGLNEHALCSSKLLKSEADWISLGLNSHSEMRKFIESGKTVSSNLLEKNSILAESRVRESGLLDKVPGCKINLVDSAKIILDSQSLR